MTITDALAAYGAVLSTIGVVWNVLLFLRDSPRVVLSVMLARRLEVEGQTFPAWRKAECQNEATHLVVKIVNHGRRPVQVTTLCFQTRSKEGVFLGTPHCLPKTISENDFVIEFTDDLAFMAQPLSAVFVADSTGRKWKLPRKQVTTLNAEAVNLGIQKA